MRSIEEGALDQKLLFEVCATTGDTASLRCLEEFQPIPLVMHIGGTRLMREF